MFYYDIKRRSCSVTSSNKQKIGKKYTFTDMHLPLLSKFPLAGRVQSNYFKQSTPVFGSENFSSSRFSETISLFRSQQNYVDLSLKYQKKQPVIENVLFIFDQDVSVHDVKLELLSDASQVLQKKIEDECALLNLLTISGTLQFSSKTKLNDSIQEQIEKLKAIIIEERQLVANISKIPDRGSFINQLQQVDDVLVKIVEYGYPTLRAQQVRKWWEALVGQRAQAAGIPGFV